MPLGQSFLSLLVVQRIYQFKPKICRSCQLQKYFTSRWDQRALNQGCLGFRLKPCKGDELPREPPFFLLKKALKKCKGHREISYCDWPALQEPKGGRNFLKNLIWSCVKLSSFSYTLWTISQGSFSSLVHWAPRNRQMFLGVGCSMCEMISIHEFIANIGIVVFPLICNFLWFLSHSSHFSSCMKYQAKVIQMHLKGS